MKTKQILSIILVLLWMICVFTFSNQQGNGSSSTSKSVSQIIVNIIDIQKQYTKKQKEELVEFMNPILRKIAHYTIYLIGGFLLVNCTTQYKILENKAYFTSALIGILYAASDEFHQLLIAGRSGNINDVIIDSLGVLTGITIFLLIRKTIGRSKKLGEVE